MKDEKIKILLKDKKVRNVFCKDEEMTLTLFITPEEEEFVVKTCKEAGFECIGDSFPVKVDEDMNVPYIKCKSNFAFSCAGLPAGYSIYDIGEGSVVDVYLILKNGQFRRIKYVSAYISGVEVKSFNEREEYNPFTDSEFKSMAAASIEDSADTPKSSY